MLHINRDKPQQTEGIYSVNQQAQRGNIRVVVPNGLKPSAIAPNVCLRLNERKIALDPTRTATNVSSDMPRLNTGNASQPAAERAQCFIQSLKNQADHLNMSVVEFISGDNSHCVLKRLYLFDQSLALALIKTRLQCYQDVYNDAEMMHLGDNEDDGTEQEQEIQAMLEALDKASASSAETDFDYLLRSLKVFEQKENRVPFADRYDLALLQLAGIAEHPKLTAVPESIVQSSALTDPTDLALTSSQYLVWQHNPEKIEEAIQEICNTEAYKHHENFLLQSIIWLFDNGQLDPEHATTAENLQSLCETAPEQVEALFSEFYKEARRKDSTVQDGLQGYTEATDKSNFLKTLMATDKPLIAWIRGSLTQQLIALYEQQLLSEMQTPAGKARNNQVWLCRLTHLVRQAKACNYTVDEKISNKLEVLQLVTMQSYINKNKAADSPLWFPDGTMTVKQIKAHLASADKQGIAGCVKALQYFLSLSMNVNSFEEQKCMLQAKDALIKAQIEYLFTQTRAHIDSADKLKNSKKADFEVHLKKIAALEALRPPAALLSEKFTFSGMISGLGCHLLRGAEIPVHQRLRDIYLEYQLKYHFSYDFTTQINAQIQALPGQVCTAAGVMADQMKNVVNFIYKTVSGQISISEACRTSFSIQKGASNALLDTVRKQLEDYAELCEHHPHMARVLAGNVAQTIAVIENTVSNKSELYNIFNQFKKRISMEAMAAYMTEQFDPAAMDITCLDAEKATALKRMFALCQFFQWAPEVITGTVGAAEIMSQAASGSVFGTAWSAFKTAFKIASTTMVKQGVSTLSDEDVKGINMTMMTIEYGPQEAARRLQLMQTSAEVLAEQAKGHSIKYSAIKALCRPFTIRFTRLKATFALWKEGKGSFLSFCSEAIKATAVVAPIVVSVVATPVVVSVLGPALIGYTITAGPALSMSLTALFYQTDPFKDMTLLINKKVAVMLEPGMADIEQRAREATRSCLQNGGYNTVKRYFAYEKLYTQFWADFQARNPHLATALENKFAQDVTTDKTYNVQLKTVQTAACELRQLEQVLQGNATKRETIVACLSDTVKSQVPADATQAIYWAIARVQRNREMLLQELGTRLIPGDDQAVAKRFFQFRKKLTMVELMRQHEMKIDRCLPAMLAEAEKTVGEVVESLHKQTSLLFGKVVIHRAIINMAGDASLSQDKLDRMINRREQFSRRISDQLRVMKHITNA
ncbi:MAG: hypothetical protein OXC48_07635 [Endozoicomonadaceae bacterium]|nr:hypothetical protein [Endozoicomonadaceae bacterium]